MCCGEGERLKSHFYDVYNDLDTTMMVVMSVPLHTNCLGCLAYGMPIKGRLLLVNSDFVIVVIDSLLDNLLVACALWCFDLHSDTNDAMRHILTGAHQVAQLDQLAGLLILGMAQD